MTQKEFLIATIKAMRESTNKDDPCWNKADFLIQEWENEHRPKKAKNNKESD
jgi:hypothetical protein